MGVEKMFYIVVTFLMAFMFCGFYFLNKNIQKTLNKIAQVQDETFDDFNSYEGKLIIAPYYDDTGQPQEIVDMSRYEKEGLIGLIRVNPPEEMEPQFYENALVIEEGDTWGFVIL